MRAGQRWLATTLLLVSLHHSTEMKHRGDVSGLELYKENLNIRHHHRHKHKDLEPTFIDNIKFFDVVSFKDDFGKNLYDITPNDESKMDWMNMSNDQVGEMKDKKHLHWPIKREAVIEGDLVIGGLMMVHERSDNMTCGPVMPQGGVQALETMLYTLDIINNELKLIPGVTMGAHVLDDCDKDTYGLEMAVDFIKGSISNIDDAEYACNATAVRKVISGVVGAASSVTSVQVANLLRLFRIPQVSFFSTSPELSNKARFEYFTRTIPSDLHQVRAMVEIVTKLGWSYVSIIYEESSYGIKAFEELEALLARNGICIAVKEKLVKDSGVADERAYDDIVQKLLTKPRARGAIIFGSDQEVAGVMRAVERGNATSTFSWVGSDGWSARSLVSDGNERAVEGTISVQPQANDVKGFKEYFLGLNVKNNKRNPWFVEFWEDHFQCRYPGSLKTPYNTQFQRQCSGLERLTDHNTEFERQLQFVSDAVLTFAYAIRDMHAAVCGGRPGLCDGMRPASGAELLRYLRKVNFTGLSGDEFHFDNNGDGPARYNILHFKQVSKDVYRWVNVGQYLDGELELDLDEIQFKWESRRPPESVCSAECELGQAKQYVEGESCCWHCFNCTQYEIRSPYVETACMVCPRGTLPDATRTHCRQIPEAYLRPDSAWAIGAMSFSSAGILLTAFVCGVWFRHSSTPVVRASGRELSYVLLAGILMCYLVTFALVFRPTDILCSIQRFGTGFCFTVVYAALLTKTNRISRIFNASKHSAKRPILISPSSQLAICAALISIQKQYSVIIFSYENVEYISASPNSWLNEEEKTCLWPKSKNIERKAINLNMAPEADWITLKDIRVIGHYANLKTALAVEKSRQLASSSETECVKRKITKNKKYRDDSLSPPPLLNNPKEALAVETSRPAVEASSSETEPDKQMITENLTMEPIGKESKDNGYADLLDDPDLDVRSSPSSLAHQDSSDLKSLTCSEISNKKEFDYIAESLVELKTLITYTMRKVEAIEKKIGVCSLNDKNAADNLINRLPLKELSVFEDFERELKQSETMKNQLLQYMKFSGGATEKDCVNRCLEKIFTNYLAQYCSWTGRKNNYKLCGLTVMDIIKAAVKENFPSSTDEQFERAVMMWFQHACTRIKRSK